MSGNGTSRAGPKRLLIAALAAWAAAVPAWAAPETDPFCGPGAAPIMILGTYHMSNPGLDAHNLEADDVLAPRRQREIADLVERLARFRPTKVMTEAPYRHRPTIERYRAYLAGDHELGRNETEQIGFRLGKMLGIASITPIDFPMRMSGLRPDEIDDAWRPKPAPEMEQQAAPAAPAIDPKQEKLRTATVREFLLWLNEPGRAESEHSEAYLELLLPEDGPALYQRSDYLVNWYKRNFRMFANIARETDFAEDRVLVIVGAGHLKILRDLARDASYFCLVEPAQVLR